MSNRPIAQLPVRRLISMSQGQNCWLNGCLAFLMQCLGEDREYDYWFFSGATGDSFTQVYSKDPQKMVLSYSDIAAGAAVRAAFDACGYCYEYTKYQQPH